MNCNTTSAIGVLAALLMTACASPPAPISPTPPVTATPEPAVTRSSPQKPEPGTLVAVDSDDEGYKQGEQLEQAALHYGEQVKEIFGEHQDAINQCYLRELKKNPELGGQLVVNLTVSPDGKLRQDPLFTQNTLQNRKTEGCLFNIIKNLTYPKPYNEEYAKVEHVLVFGAF